MMNACPLCLRELDENPDKHHLIPKTFKGSDTVTIHRVCHRAIHATFTERELLHHYNTIDKLLESDIMRKFVDWVKKKPIDFYISIDETKERKSKRRQ